MGGRADGGIDPRVLALGGELEMVDRKTEISDHFIHAGGGTAVAFAYLSLIPGFIPIVALTVLVGAVLVAPLVILGLAAVLIAAPFYLASRVVRRAPRRRRRKGRPHGMRPLPVESPHAS